MRRPQLSAVASVDSASELAVSDAAEKEEDGEAYESEVDDNETGSAD
jgi:hypothetical protein